MLGKTRLRANLEPTLLRSLVSLSGIVTLAVRGMATAKTNQKTASGETELISRETLFGNPEKTQARLSPDGAQLSYLAPVDGVLNVWVGPVDDPEAAKPVTNDTGRGVRSYVWAYTGNDILYVQDKGGDENWHLYRVNLDSGETTDLTPIDGVQAQLQEVSPELPGEVLVGLNDRNPELHDLYRVNLKSGRRELVYKNEEGFIDFVTDDFYEVYFGVRAKEDGGNEMLRRTREGDWERFIDIGMEDSLGTQPFGLDKSGGTLYLADSRERDTAAAVAVNLATGEETALFEDPQADVSGAIIHPTEKTLQAVASEYERARWTVLDKAIRGDLEVLRKVAGGDINVVDRTLNDAKWLVAYTLDDGPTTYYLYDRDEEEVELLFTDRPALEDTPLAAMQPLVIRARDGFKLVSYLTLPVGSDSDDARPDEPLPMILLVHGGPWGRDSWGFNPYHQWLANRGYAVLSVNFRGSTGFGKAFVNAGNLEWGAAMHDDLIDAVDWAVAEGIAQKGKIAIMGGSYGGYATLAGLTFTPEVFAAGVDIVGPSNLVTLIESVPPYWKPMLSMFTTRVGNPSTDEGRALLKKRSPLTHAETIAKPLLIGQGANDPRVKQAESDQIVEAMQAKEIPVTYLLYPDEGHGFARPKNNLSFNAVAEAFLAKHLGGRFEPVGDDFEGSSLQVVTGAEQVPGLEGALGDNQ